MSLCPSSDAGSIIMYDLLAGAVFQGLSGGLGYVRLRLARAAANYLTVAHTRIHTHIYAYNHVHIH